MDENDFLIGVVSDGDVRRGLLAYRDINGPIEDLINKTPVVVRPGASSDKIFQLFERYALTAIPVVDDKGCVQDLIIPFQSSPNVKTPKIKLNGVSTVIMAGGEGQRLRPLTKTVPKPLLKVGGKPLIERMVSRLISSGLRDIYVSVNYLGEKIEDHFGDGKRFGANISYLREQQKLGTAGALSLLPVDIDGDVLVLNGDVIVGTEFSRFVNFHKSSGCAITVAVTPHDVTIPYGVVDVQNELVAGIDEKPTNRFLVNAGMYVVQSRIIHQLEREKPINMTDIIAQALAAGEEVTPFFLHEPWLDVGTPAQYQVAHEIVHVMDS
ncbi:MAG: nucleotidyltransferase family protein [Sneathiella sp.]|nr:nucleotidyltransferase family protein [Sneathiella sp.]